MVLQISTISRLNFLLILRVLFIGLVISDMEDDPVAALRFTKSLQALSRLVANSFLSEYIRDEDMLRDFVICSLYMITYVFFWFIHWRKMVPARPLSPPPSRGQCTPPSHPSASPNQRHACHSHRLSGPMLKLPPIGERKNRVEWNKIFFALV